VLAQIHSHNRVGNELSPMIIHVITKVDRALKNVQERNDQTLRGLHKTGVIGNFLYVSPKSGDGMSELKTAIFESNIRLPDLDLVEPQTFADPWIHEDKDFGGKDFTKGSEANLLDRTASVRASHESMPEQNRLDKSASEQESHASQLL